jgi:hypothetical protein
MKITRKNLEKLIKEETEAFLKEDEALDAKYGNRSWHMQMLRVLKEIRDILFESNKI